MGEVIVSSTGTKRHRAESFLADTTACGRNCLDWKYTEPVSDGFPWEILPGQNVYEVWRTFCSDCWYQRLERKEVAYLVLRDG